MFPLFSFPPSSFLSYFTFNYNTTRITFKLHFDSENTSDQCHPNSVDQKGWKGGGERGSKGEKEEWERRGRERWRGGKRE